MKKSFKTYFQSEKELLDESLQDFSTHHPEMGRALGLEASSERDPHIERLLEGCSYLAARVRQQIDLGLNHTYDDVVRRIAPNFVRPTPSMTMIEFYSPHHQLSETEHLGEGILLASEAVGQEQCACTFQTTDQIAVQPISIRRIKMFHTDEEPLIRIDFEINDGVDLSKLRLGHLPIFINASYKLALKWHYLLLREVSGIDVRTYRSNSEPEQITHLNPSHIQFKTWNTGIIKGDSLQRSPLTFIKHTTSFPELAFFISIDLSEKTFQTYLFSIDIHLKKETEVLKPQPDLFKINVVPAINLFEMSAEPIITKPNKTEYTLHVQNDKTQSFTIYSLNHIQGIQRKNSERFDLEDYDQQSYSSLYKHTYRLKQEHTNELVLKNKIILSPQLKDESVLSSLVQCTNGHYPHTQLSKMMLKVKDRSVSTQLRATNIVKPSPYRESHHNPAKSSHYLSLINMDIFKLSEKKNLVELLSMLDHSGKLSSGTQAIESSAIEERHIIKRGVFTNVLLFDLNMTLHGPFDLFEAHHFGNLLFPFLKSFTPVNVTFELQINLNPDKLKLSWASDDAK